MPRVSIPHEHFAWAFPSCSRITHRPNCTCTDGTGSAGQSRNRPLVGRHVAHGVPSPPSQKRLVIPRTLEDLPPLTLCPARSTSAPCPNSSNSHEHLTGTDIPTLPTPAAIRPELSEEEKQRNFEIGKTYNRMMAQHHNTLMADLTMKVKLRDDAIAHLPEILQHAARQKDTNLPPSNRRIATYTPPIPGYNPMDYARAEEEDLEEVSDNQ